MNTSHTSRSDNSDETGGVTITEARDKAGRKQFALLPFAIYGPGDGWSPPLIVERLEHFDPDKNPFFRHADVGLFLAWRDGRCVGRISAQVDRLYLEHQDKTTGFFGFIDAIDDAAVFKALFEAAEDFVRARGMTRMLGPFSFSINDESGLLIDGFGTPPRIMMGHAKPYYRSHIEALGYAKEKDLIAYDYGNKDAMPMPVQRVLQRVANTGDLKLRPFSLKNIDRDLKIILDIFNDAWRDNWGFVPMTAEEVDQLGHNLKLFVREEFISIAEYRGEPAAMAVTFPDINLALADLDGRLLPFGWAKLLWRLKVTSPRAVRLPLMGVLKKYQLGLVGSALAFAVIDKLRTVHIERGAETSELSWVLEDNLSMRRMIEILGADPYKTYRMYKRAL